jgi:hypothetical protein
MNDSKIVWLRRVLLFKVIVTFAMWGLPTLVGPAAFLALFGIDVPAEPIFLRLFGAVVTAFGVAYWLAYRAPVKNAVVVKVGIVDNGLVTLTIIALGLTAGVTNAFIWISAALTTFFCVAFSVLLPREAKTSP